MQNPGVCFQEPDLKSREAKLDMLGHPRVMSGNFASVYEMKTGDGRWAIRCFVRQVPGQQGRYARLCQYLNNLTLPYLVKFDYMLKGILVKGDFYPIVKMEWVEGVPLNTWVEDNLSNPQALLKLAEDWRAMMKELSQHKLAHGDLQHGNIMVTPDNELRLVDYDGMYAPVFGRGRAPELGHVNFQHPRRTADFYQEDLDNFSALVIYTSLRALAVEPELWQKFYTVDNLILLSSDYKNPLNSPAFAKLKESKDPVVQQMAKLLEKCCLSPVDNVPDFNEVMAALDKGTLESLPMKTPSQGGAGPSIAYTRPAHEGPLTQGTRPAPAAISSVVKGARSAYEGGQSVATQPLKSRPAPAQAQQQSSKAPAYNMPPQPQEKSSGIPPWVWAVAGALIAGIIFLVISRSTNSDSAPQNSPQENSPASEGSRSSVTPTEATPEAVSAPAPVVVTPSVKLNPLGTLKGHAGSVDTLTFSADGKYLASGSADKVVRLWDAQTGLPKRQLTGSSDTILGVTILSDEKLVCGVTADNVLTFWDMNTGEIKKKIEDYRDNLFPISISHDGHLLATGSQNDRKTVRIVAAASGSVKRVFQNHSSWIKSVSFSPDATMAVSICHDESVNILDLATGKIVHTLTVTGNTVETPVFSKDNKYLATGGDGRSAKVWDVKNGGLVSTFNNQTSDVKACAFSDDGKLLVTGSADGSLKVWDMVAGTEKSNIAAHNNAVTILAFAPQGTVLASGSADQSIRLYELKR